MSTTDEEDDEAQQTSGDETPNRPRFYHKQIQLEEPSTPVPDEVAEETERPAPPSNGATAPQEATRTEEHEPIDVADPSAESEAEKPVPIPERPSNGAANDGPSSTTEEPRTRPVSSAEQPPETPRVDVPPAVPADDWRRKEIEAVAAKELGVTIDPAFTKPHETPPTPAPTPVRTDAPPEAATEPAVSANEALPAAPQELDETIHPQPPATAGPLPRVKRMLRALGIRRSTGSALQPGEVKEALGVSESTALKGLRSEERQRVERETAEARELERLAKEAKQRLRDRRRVQASLTKQERLAARLAERAGLDPNRPITEIPPLPDPDMKEIELTAVVPDRTFIRVSLNAKTGRHLYEVIEPKLTDAERTILDFLRDTLVRTLETPKGVDENQLRQELIEAIDRAIVDHSIVLDDVSRKRIEHFLVRDILGLGTIDALMRDGQIEDISCLGPNIPIYLFHRRYEAVRTNIVFEDPAKLDSFVIWLAQRSGKQISVAEPILDATLPDKSRLQTTLSREVTPRGSSFTIRKFRADPLTPSDLVSYGSLSAQLAAYFWFLMEEGQSIVYAGGTASGKTSLLNAVSIFIPPQKKIVSIEDTREINLPHENWISGLTRAGFGGENIGGKVAGTIDMYRLLEAALRQRPEYILVGEVRGAEALTLFQAMATGHATYSTLHAENVRAAVNRIESPPIFVPRVMLSSLGAIVIQMQVRLNNRMVRRIKEIAELVGIDDETKELIINTVFRWEIATDKYVYAGRSHLLDRISKKKNMTGQEILAEWQRRTRVIDWMVRTGVRKIADVMAIVSTYYSDPAAVLRAVEESEAPKPLAAGGGVVGRV